MRCPGQDTAHWTDDFVTETECPACGREMEFFKDESSRRCPKCGHRFTNPKLDLGCAEWCEHAEDCLGYAPARKEKPPPTGAGPLASRLIGEMKRVFGRDQKRIGHALRVFQYAKEISREEGGDARVVLAAAILHDIGIHEAERKHGSSAGRYQEIEGPPIARRIMEDAGLDAGTIDHVCRIIANHHSAKDIDTKEFRIVWDSDWLVNLPEEHPDPDRDTLRGLVGRIFKTEAGRQKAEKRFLN
jgi:hypothetical protein